jgi:hypothetical protein
MVLNVMKSLPKLVDDALQHLKIQHINKQVVIYSKETSSNKSYVVWFPQQSLLFPNLKIHFIFSLQP